MNGFRRIFKAVKKYFKKPPILESFRFDIIDFGIDPIELNIKIYE